MPGRDQLQWKAPSSSPHLKYDYFAGSSEDWEIARKIVGAYQDWQATLQIYSHFPSASFGTRAETEASSLTTLLREKKRKNTDTRSVPLRGCKRQKIHHLHRSKPRVDPVPATLCFYWSPHVSTLFGFKCSDVINSVITHLCVEHSEELKWIKMKEAIWEKAVSRLKHLNSLAVRANVIL